MTAPSLRRSVALTFVSWIAIFQLVAFLLSAWWIAWPLLRAASNDFAALIVLSAQTWVELPPQRRSALQDALSTTHGLHLIDTGKFFAASTSPSYLPFNRLLQDKLSDLTGQPAHVGWDPNRQQYLVDIQVDCMPMHFAFARERIGTNPPFAILAILLTSLTLALLVAHQVSCRLTRPLTRLERAVQAVGRGETPALLPKNSVLELDGLSHEFNAMARQVHAQTQSRTTLLAGVSHDLRSPVTRLRMALELARTHPDPVLFDNMERYLEQMDALIGDFIDYGRVISQNMPQHLELTPWLTQLAEEHQATLTSCGDGMLLTDPAALRRILTNLLENAHNHAPDSPAELVCSRTRDGVQIDVLDRGPGISPEHLDKIFDPFYRIDPARQSPGSGLGLAIVREVCRAHGWRIQISNRPRGGLQARLILLASLA